MAAKKGKSKTASTRAPKTNRKASKQEVSAAEVPASGNAKVTVAPEPKRRRNAKKAAKEAASNSSEALMPAVGTVIKKLDRNGKVRCECTVVPDGVRYQGNLYKSLSGAAAAAASDLGLSGKSFNGFIFWSLKKPNVAVDPIERLERLWQRYSSAALELLRQDAPAEQKEARTARVRQHVAQLQTAAA